MRSFFDSSAAPRGTPRALLDSAARVAIAAGEAMMGSFKDPSQIVSHLKADGSPVTNVDTTASALIVKRLGKLTPDLPVITEENVAGLPSSLLHSKDRAWVVDPLDGTSEFQQGKTGFAINISLFEGLKPVLGVIYQPALAMGFCAAEGGKGAFRFDTLDGKIRSVQPLNTRLCPPDGCLTTVFRKTSGNDPVYQSLRGRLDQAGVRLPADPDTSVGIIREMRVVMGRADLCVKLGSKPGAGGGGYPWDIGAMILIVEQAGGCIRTWTGEDLEIHALDERVPSLLVFADPSMARKSTSALRTIAGPVSENTLAKGTKGTVECPPEPSRAMPFN